VSDDVSGLCGSPINKTHIDEERSPRQSTGGDPQGISVASTTPSPSKSARNVVPYAQPPPHAGQSISHSWPPYCPNAFFNAPPRAAAPSCLQAVAIAQRTARTHTHRAPVRQPALRAARPAQRRGRATDELGLAAVAADHPRARLEPPSALDAELIRQYG
jgi:hypothetical protein